MENLFRETLSRLIAAFKHIESSVPAPRLVSEPGYWAFRYTERTLEQALVQKLARMISGLGAARVLLERGFVQEIGVLQRTLDELGEDVAFLCLPLHGEAMSSLHQAYLDAFYEEEFSDSNDVLGSSQRRPMVPRKKVRAAIAKSQVAPLNPSDHIELNRTLSKAYSGYVHAASPHIMEMYGGWPPHFHLDGMLGTPRIEAGEHDLWNYFYRGMFQLLLVAQCFRLEALVVELLEFLRHFETESGRS